MKPIHADRVPARFRPHFLKLTAVAVPRPRTQPGPLVLDSDPLRIDERKVVGHEEWSGLRVALIPTLEVQQILSPVHVAIAQVIMPVLRPASQFIEISHAVW